MAADASITRHVCAGPGRCLAIQQTCLSICHVSVTILDAMNRTVKKKMNKHPHPLGAYVLMRETDNRQEKETIWNGGRQKQSRGRNRKCRGCYFANRTASGQVALRKDLKEAREPARWALEEELSRQRDRHMQRPWGRCAYGVCEDRPAWLDGACAGQQEEMRSGWRWVG